MNEIIRVRDRRVKYQFSIHNSVIDHWVPIIGIVGLSLYNLYTRLASYKEERAWPGYTLITRHLGLSKSSVSRHNQLLVLCRLIHIDPGTPTLSNDYYILDVPICSAELRSEIRDRVPEVFGSDPFAQTVLKRLAAWQPIEVHWKKRSPSIKTTQGSTLVEQGSTLVEQGSTLVEQGSTLVEQGVPAGYQNSNKNSTKQQPKEEVNNNNKSSAVVAVVSCLSDFGITEPILSEIGPLVSPTQAMAWILYTDTLTGLRNPPGFVAAQIRRGSVPPPDFLALAEIYDEDWQWLEDNVSARRMISRWPDGLPVEVGLAEKWFQYHLAINK